MASRLFDSLVSKERGELHTCIIAAFGKKEDVPKHIDQLRNELRLAALLHDVGHSLHSHASERVYGRLKILQEAANELSRFTGKRKGAGEVISFCFALTPCLKEYLARAENNLLAGVQGGEAQRGNFDLHNVALLIVGRSKHPYLQFMADIISSDIDADKLDYLLRDSTSAGLPLRYDVDMYLYSAEIELDVMSSKYFFIPRRFRLKLHTEKYSLAHRKRRNR
jgi:HD superfamily phosphohydrolase